MREVISSITLVLRVIMTVGELLLVATRPALAALVGSVLTLATGCAHCILATRAATTAAAPATPATAPATRFAIALTTLAVGTPIRTLTFLAFSPRCTRLDAISNWIARAVGVTRTIVVSLAVAITIATALTTIALCVVLTTTITRPFTTAWPALAVAMSATSAIIATLAPTLSIATAITTVPAVTPRAAIGVSMPAARMFAATITSSITTTT